ncbi:hypothetical protein BKA60DRAFT_627146 [Fusarium oxysporum]|nr:hypothetical protein BKA60DRAFT_627146 [Fusarium oxysporum]
MLDAMSSIKTVAVLGASGNVGQVVIASLLKAEFNITVVTRPGSKPFHLDNITVKTADYGSLPDLTEAFKGIDAVVEAFNPAAAVHQATIVRAAISAGVSHLITPDFSSDTFNQNIIEIPNYEPKLQAQRELESLVAASNGALTWTAIITGGWFDWGISNAIFWVDRKNRTITRFGSGNQKYCLSNLKLCGDAVAHVLKQPEKYRNRPAYFANFTVTTNDLTRLINEVAGGSWQVLDVNVDDTMKQGRLLWDEDTKNGVQTRLGTPAYLMLGSASLFDEGNRYGADFSEKVEPGWEKTEEELGKELEALLK